MAGPIGYIPPANTRGAMPIEQPRFTGINPVPAQAAALQSMAPIEQKIQQSAQYDDNAKKAAEFQRLLSQGVSGMQSYIADVQAENPELASHFGQELQTMAPFLQTMKGKDLNDAVFNLYDSWNGRYNGAKLSRVMGQPGATREDIFGAYGQMGGNAKDLMGAYVASEKQDTAALLAGAKIKDLEAHSEYLKGRPELLKELENIKNEGRARAARIRSKTTGNKTSYQTTLRNSTAMMDGINRNIATLSQRLAETDPMEAHYIGLDTQMHQLRSEKLRVQGWINRAIEKGAKPDEDFEVDAPDGITAPGGAGTHPPATPPAPGATVPAPAVGSISSSSDDTTLSAYYKAMTNQDPTPKDLEEFRAALRQDNR